VAPSFSGYLPYLQQGAFGLAIILFLIFEPEGIVKLWRNVKDYFRLWPFSY
jgi:branched-chain amino acid transport system permease protein